MINCLLVGPPHAGGIGTYLEELVSHPPDDIVYSLNNQFHHSTEYGRCNVVEEVLLNRFIHRFLRYTHGFRVLSPSDEVDIVHIHSQPVKIRSQSRIPIVMSAGASHYDWVLNYAKWSERKIHHRYGLARNLYPRLHINDELLHTAQVTRIYCFSEWARQIYIRHGVPSTKVDVIPPGMELPSQSNPLKKYSKDNVNFLFVGRHFDRKGGPLIIEAFKILKQKMASISLTVVTEEVEKLGQVEGMTVLPLMDRHTLYKDIYPTADVFIMPTEAEGWGFTNAEAMSFGLPVISTKVGAIPEIVEHGKTGLLIEHGDGDALVTAMRRLAESADLREEMGNLGRERFINCFSRDVFNNRLREFYYVAMRS